MKALLFQKILFNWFDAFGRSHLPWQQNKTPYRVWISEIMLQQTQVNTVLPYFNRFMQQFPNVEALAAASTDEVLHLWAGLGYYSRARNLHRTAKIIVEEFAGVFPNQMEVLVRLPGIGPSTAGAILSIAFNQPAVILDGNVKRVLSRLHAICEPINDKQIENKLWALAEYYLPKQRNADYTQAIMDFGATLCMQKNPNCLNCPFVKNCAAKKAGVETTIPYKKSRDIPKRDVSFLIFIKNEFLFLQKRPNQGIWGGLWSLPEHNGVPDLKVIQNFCQQNFNLKIATFETLPTFAHRFTHYHLNLHPVLIAGKKLRLKKEDQIWYNLRKPQPIGLPKPIQSIVSLLNDTTHIL